MKAALLLFCLSFSVLQSADAAQADANVILVSKGGDWHYLDDGSDQGTAWRDPAFDDSAWSVGAAHLGYGDGDEVTRVRCRVTTPVGAACASGAPNDRILTTYFRRSFHLSSPAAFSALDVDLTQDDGAVLYLNGEEVLRVNMPAGEIFYDTPAAGVVGNENAFVRRALDVGDLVAGENVLAVEVHQISGGSSDISFDLALLATDTALPNLTRGPYLQRATPTSAVVRWRSDTAVVGQVNYGLSPEALTQEIVAGSSATEHVLELTGLAPQTRYYYSIGTPDGRLAGGDPEHTFLTPPAPTPPEGGVSPPVRIWVIGDSGTANHDARAVQTAFQRTVGAERPDLWLMLGDNAYPDGTDEEYQAAVFDLYPSLLRRTWLWPTVGNHDAISANSATQTGPYFESFTLPTAAESGGLASGTEAYYSFDYGPVHFVTLDSAEGDLNPGSAMLTWLEADVLATTKEWIIAFWHHPPYTKGSHDSDSLGDSNGKLFAVRENVLPLLEAAGVDLVLTGHSHSYERSLLLDGHYGTSDTLDASMILDAGDGDPAGDGAYVKAPWANRGTVYALAGSSGKVGGGSLDHPAMEISLARLGSLLLDIEGTRLEGRFIDDEGTIFDTFVVVHETDLFADDFESGDTSQWSSSQWSSVQLMLGTVGDMRDQELSE